MTRPVPPPVLTPAEKAERLRECQRCGRNWGLVWGLLLIVGGAIGADYWIGVPADAQATFVGGQRCAECHQHEANLWTGSHHDLAMDHATNASVLGDFNDATFEHHGIVSRMFRRGEKFYINTEGPDGKLADFEIKYTFGVSPLQQYLVEFDRPDDMPPHEVARLQCLRICWNTLKKEWFYLPPPDVSEKLEPGDDLHWTGVAQRWNNMCADCHSTNLKKNFDVATNVYHTTFSEIDVSCEACHGPGSLHVQLAEAPGFLKWDRKLGYALADLKGKDVLDNKPQVETCAPCHSRRRVLDAPYPGGQQFHNFFANEFLAENAYHADGQILDEVYEYGSFCQSKMYHKGIRCTDCHNPHNLKLKFEGNKLCTSCHAHPASRYDILSHHHHRDGTAGAQCVNCHMPVTTYMEVDPRRDHSLRMPRPDLSVQFQTPNACTGCHIEDVKGKLPADVTKAPLREYADWLRVAREGNKTIAEELAKLDQWSADAVVKWYGKDRKSNVPHFVEKLAPARKDAAEGVSGLLELLGDDKQPDIARATAAIDLGPFAEQPEVVQALAKALQDDSPQIRAAAVMSFFYGGDAAQLNVVVPLLDDPIRFVRIEAARALAHIPEESLHAKVARRRDEVMREFEASVLMDNDRANAHLVLGSMYESAGRFAEAETAYRNALRVEPNAVGARRNLSALLEARSQEFMRQAQQFAAQRNREAAEFAHTKGIELQDQVIELREQELALLKRDAALAANNAAVQHNLGLSLYLHGKFQESEAALKRAAELAPEEPRFAYYLSIFYRDTGRPKEATEWAKVAAKLRPDRPEYRQLVDELKADANAGQTLPAEPGKEK